MMRPALTPKTPDDVADYGVDWDLALATGVTIDTSTWTVPAGITKDDDSIDDDERATVVRLSGGTAGEEYTLVNEIVTSAGETLNAAIEIRVLTAAQIAGI